MSQRDHFLASGGDDWFTQNVGEVERRGLEGDLILQMLTLYHLRPQRVLEIGAGTGQRLDAIRTMGAEVTALEPSALALAYMREHSPEIRQVLGAVPGSGLSERFDLIIVNFVLEYIDRDLLYAGIAEIDSLLDEGGYLLLGDFTPTQPIVWSFQRPGQQQIYQIFKQDYPALFLASGFYREIATLGGLHDTGLLLDATVTPIDMNRFGLSLLKKSVATTYVPIVQLEPQP